jgi:hypothetical protein
VREKNVEGQQKDEKETWEGRENRDKKDWSIPLRLVSKASRGEALCVCVCMMVNVIRVRIIRNDQ